MSMLGDARPCTAVAVVEALELGVVLDIVEVGHVVAVALVLYLFVRRCSTASGRGAG